jgi:uncharacterized iron-regulated membrane protein
MNLRKLLFWIHLSVGCAAGAVVFIMSVTGALLAYERQIISWLDRSARSAPLTPDSHRLAIEVLVAKSTAQSPGAPTAITLRSERAAPAEVSFGREHILLVDAYSGAVLGESSPRARAFFQTMEDWHRWLGASNEQRATARAVTGASNLGFLVLVLTGPFLWLPKKWSWQNVKARAMIGRGLSGRARDFNWHLSLGIWCAAPLLLIVMSGVVMSYPWANDLLYRLTGNEPAARGNGPRGEAGRRGPQSSASLEGLDRLWAQAEQQAPGWRSISLRMPPSQRAPVTFAIDTGNGGRPDQRSQLTIDRRTEVAKWERFSDYNAGRRLRSWFRFMHTGEAGGVAGETVAGAASAISALLVWTGISLAIRRLLRWKSRRLEVRERMEAASTVSS